jgi:hypothetical protein
MGAPEPRASGAPQHTYPPGYPPGRHWALDEAWAILDLVPPGVIPADVRAFLAPLIAGRLLHQQRVNPS